MNANDILEILRERNKGAGIAALYVLESNKQPINRDQLRKQTDEMLIANDLAPVFKSRHGIEKYISKLDGAGLIDIHSFGTAHLYSISELGEQLLKYHEVQIGK